MDKELINALNSFFISEYGDDATIDKLPNNGIIHLAYAIYELDNGEQKEMQVDFDLTNLKYLNYVDNILVSKDLPRDTRDSIQDFIVEINICTFEDLMRECINDYQLYINNY